MKPNYSRTSFVESVAPYDHQCSCGCGAKIKRKEPCFTRPYVERGRVTGHTRILSLDHYDDWLESVAHAYAQKIVDRRPELRGYFEGRPG